MLLLVLLLSVSVGLCGPPVNQEGPSRVLQGAGNGLTEGTVWNRKLLCLPAARAKSRCTGVIYLADSQCIGKYVLKGTLYTNQAMSALVYKSDVHILWTKFQNYITQSVFIFFFWKFISSNSVLLTIQISDNVLKKKTPRKSWTYFKF